MPQVDDLSIKISASANDGVKALDKVAKSLGKIKSAIDVIPNISTKINDEAIENLAVVSQRLAKALQPLAAECEKIASGMRAMSGAAGTAAKAEDNMAKATDRNTAAQRRNASSSMTVADKWNKLKQNASGFIAKIWAIRWAFNMVTGTIGKFVQVSMDYEETLNMFTATMGQYADKYKQYAETLEGTVGISSADWMKNQATFFTLINGFGVASDEAAHMSENLTRLGYDMASFWNTDFDTAMQKLESGITGQTKAVRAFGIDISNAAIEEARLELGIKKTTAAMSQAEKTEMRYYIMMNNVTQAHGDLIRTLDTPANQLRLLQNQFEITARSIGNIFIPILNKVLPLVTAVMKAIKKLADMIAGLFGYKLTDVDYSGLAGGGNGMDTSGLDDVADSAGNAGKNIGNATKELKKFKRQLAGFDEINNLTSNENSPKSGGGNSGGGGGGGIGSGGSLIDWSKIGYDWDLEGIADQTYEKMKKIFNKWAGLIATACIGIGLLLICLGHPLLGIGFIMMGISIAVLAYKNPDVDKKVKKYLSTMLVIAGVVAIALGCIMLFTGAGLPVGLGLIFAGASMIVTSMALTGKLTLTVKSLLQTLLDIVSPFFLALGVALLFTGAGIPIGLGLIFIGVVGMVASMKLSDGIKGKIKKMLHGILLIASAAFLALGMILCTTVVGIPLGIALIIAGVASMIAAINMSDNVSTKIKKIFSRIVGVIKGVNYIALGVILCLTIKGMKQGIGFIIKGVKSIAPNSKITEDGLKKKIKNVLTKIKNVITGKLKIALGLILCLTPLGFSKGIALIREGITGKGDDLDDGKTLKEKIANMLGFGDDDGFVISIGAKFQGWIENGKEKWDSLKESIKDKIAYAKMAYGGWKEGAMETWATLKSNITGKIVEAVMAYGGWAKNAWTYWTNLRGKIVDKTVQAFMKFGGWVKNAKTKWDNFLKAFKDKTITLKAKLTMLKDGISAKAQKFLHTLGVPGFAMGGFPDMGQLFVAREAGPEMVGTMGHQTTVANNNQIVEGISRGVAIANARQELLLQQLIKAVNNTGGGDVILRVGQDELGRAAIKGINRVQKQSGQLLLEL